MINEILIKPPEVKIKKDFDLNPSLPSVPFRICIYGSSASGKSCLVGNLLSSDEIGYKKIFKDNIFVFSTTFSLGDPSYCNCKINPENIYNEYDENILIELMTEAEANIKKYGKSKCPNVLILFDDIIHSLPTSKRGLISRLYFSGRHIKFSTILLSQALRGIPPNIRINCTASIIFGSSNQKEINKLADEQPISHKRFIEIYEDATSEPYSFLTIHNSRRKEERYQLRLSNKIYSIN
jgi:hypothetical protein